MGARKPQMAKSNHSTTVPAVAANATFFSAAGGTTGSWASSWSRDGFGEVRGMLVSEC